VEVNDGFHHKSLNSRAGHEPCGTVPRTEAGSDIPSRPYTY
jgi:hypothetical protein